ncbi:MAG: hypothetical protein AAF721_18835 [Myxococcota bacterium]
MPSILPPSPRRLDPTLSVLCLTLAAGCSDVRDKIVGHVYKSDLSTFEVVGDEEATRENRTVLREDPRDIQLMFYDSGVRLWRGDEQFDGKWSPADSSGEAIAVTIAFDERLYGEGEATFGAGEASLDLTMELPVMSWRAGQGSGVCRMLDGKRVCARTADDMTWLRKRSKLQFVLEKRNPEK